MRRHEHSQALNLIQQYFCVPASVVLSRMRARKVAGIARVPTEQTTIAYPPLSSLFFQLVVPRIRTFAREELTIILMSYWTVLRQDAWLGNSPICPASRNFYGLEFM